MSTDTRTSNASAARELAEVDEKGEDMNTRLGDESEYRLTLDDGTIRRFTGWRIASGDNGIDAYLTLDENVVVYDCHRQRYEVVEDPENDLSRWFVGGGSGDTDAFVIAMRALGYAPVIDLDA